EDLPGPASASPEGRAPPGRTCHRRGADPAAGRAGRGAAGYDPGQFRDRAEGAAASRSLAALRRRPLRGRGRLARARRLARSRRALAFELVEPALDRAHALLEAIQAADALLHLVEALGQRGRP